MLEVLVHLLLGASIFGLGMGLGGIVEFRRMRTSLYDYENLMERLCDVEDCLARLEQDIQQVKDELDRTVITQELPKCEDVVWARNTAEYISYEQYEYED